MTPPPTTRHRRAWSGITVAVVVGAVLLVGAGLVGIALGFGWWAGTSEPRPAPAAPPVSPAALPDGEMFAYVTAVGGNSLTIDPALLLTGDAAREAAERDGVIAPGQELPDDFYIVNGEPGPLEIGVAPGARLTVLTYDSGGDITEAEIALVTLANSLTGEYAGVTIYGLDAGRFPVTLSVADGVATGMTQVYLP